MSKALKEVSENEETVGNGVALVAVNGNGAGVIQFSPVQEHLNQVLRKKTPKNKIKYRPLADGTRLAYTPWHSVVERMNEAFGNGNWTREILSETAINVDKGQEIVVKVRVSTPIGSYEAYGGGKYYTNNANGSYADAAQVATSKATRRAIALTGIGLDLYTGDDEDARESSPQDLDARAAFKSMLFITGINNTGAMNALKKKYGCETAKDFEDIATCLLESNRGLTYPEALWMMIDTVRELAV